jgi:phosphoenolpyruvate carboxykinase (GTP)
MQNISLEKWTSNKELISWVQENIKLCTPSNVHLCDGSEEEYNDLCKQMAKENRLVFLDSKKRPGSILFHSHPDDVARVEESTFICSEKKEDAGPTNNWKDPALMKKHLKELFSGCMKGRTMYVIPFSMGPIGSDLSLTGVEITDSAYVVVNMKIMTRMGEKALRFLEKKKSFIPCMHSVGVPLNDEDTDDIWPCNPDKRCIVHFPEERSIYSFGSGYGGNALLGKKCLALRIASAIGKKEGWLAEHMLILKITNPQGEKKYFAAAFPSACGKTNMAMLSPSIPGWKIECIGDDIAWMHFKDGILYAINPEAGFFGVAPGTSSKTNDNAMQTISKNTIFTNVALTEDKDVWWEGMSEATPKVSLNWLGKKWDLESKEKAAHPNSRFTSPANQCPMISDDWEKIEGVPISAIIFGGRRDDVIPLVLESFSWQHGTFLGSSVSSQMTAAAKGNIGKLRHDPFAMLPFCGYNMGDYFAHWLNISKGKDDKKLPKIFFVNWFRKNDKGEFIWPGFSENIRVLKWMFQRIDNEVLADRTAIGLLPNIEDLDIEGLDIDNATLKSLFSVDVKSWLKEKEELENYFAIFEDRLPNEIKEELENLKTRLDMIKCEYSSKE